MASPCLIRDHSRPPRAELIDLCCGDDDRDDEPPPPAATTLTLERVGGLTDAGESKEAQLSLLWKPFRARRRNSSELLCSASKLHSYTSWRLREFPLLPQ